MQQGGDRFHSCGRHGLCAGIAFEQGERRWPTQIEKHLRELGKQDGEQGVNFIFVAGNTIAELAMQPH